MHRVLNSGIALLLIWAHPLRAANPDDVEFRVRLVKDAHVYHMGESIEIEISYSSQIENRYYGSFTGPSPELEGVIPHVNPIDGVLDLRELRRDRTGGWGGSSLGGLGDLGLQPVTQRFDLCQWYRFQRPGYYSVTVTSTAVSRAKAAEEGGGQEHLTLESNPVDIAILPADPAWDAAEVSSIEQEISATTNARQRDEVLRRLALLDTPDSVQMLVQLYLLSTNGGEDWICTNRPRTTSSFLCSLQPFLIRQPISPRVCPNCWPIFRHAGSLE